MSGPTCKTRIDPRPAIGRIAIVAARWNESVIDRLVAGAQQALAEAGTSPEKIDLYWVAGSFELPQAARHLATSHRYAAIIPIGCLIKGETIHDEVIAHSVAAGLDAVGRETGVPVSLGVVTANNMDQALARAGGERGNKGADAALAALDLAVLQQELAHGESDQGA